MAIEERPLEVKNMETLLEFLEDEQERPEENSFLDLQEAEILDDFIYRQMQFKKYSYAVRNVDDDFDKDTVVVDN